MRVSRPGYGTLEASITARLLASICGTGIRVSLAWAIYDELEMVTDKHLPSVNNMNTWASTSSPRFLTPYQFGNLDLEQRLVSVSRLVLHYLDRHNVFGCVVLATEYLPERTLT